MKYIKGGFFASAIIGTCAVAILVFDWSPWNLLLGPQHRALKNTRDSPTEFVDSVVPNMYSRLIQHLASAGEERLRWTSESGEAQEQLVKMLADGSIAIKTQFYTGSSPESAQTSSEITRVRMVDIEGDGLMNWIVYFPPSGGSHKYEPPFDATSQYLWDIALALTFRFSQRCQ